MTIAFVSAGAWSGAASGTAITPVNPTQTTNDLLIAFCSIKQAAVISIATAGWTLGGTVSSGNQSAAWAWAVSNGSTANPQFTWTGSVANAAQVLQYSGTQTVTPTGASSSTAVNSTTSMTIPGVTTTSNNAMILAAFFDSNSATVNAVNGANWTTDAITTNQGNGGIVVDHGFVSVSGLTSLGAQFSISSSVNTAGFQIELIGTGAAGTDNIRSSQVATEVLHTDAGATTVNVRPSQVALEVLETDSFATKVRATQVVIEVLLTQAEASLERWVGGDGNGPGAGLTWRDAFSTATLNSIANGNAILSDIIVHNDYVNPSLDMLCDISVALASAAFASPNQLSFYLYPLNKDAATYGDGRFGASAAGPPPSAYWVADMSLVAATQAQTGTVLRIPLPPGIFKFVLWNNGGVAFAASGNTCQYRTYNFQLN